MDNIKTEKPNSRTCALGIELGSTRVKAVLTDGKGRVVAKGSHTWGNRLEGGYWTYGLDEVETALQNAYAALAASYRETYGETLTEIGAVGISAMMHGYLAFDKDGNLLVPFRTWRNTTCGQASRELTEALGYPMPQRWSGTHYYQAVENAVTLESVAKMAFGTLLLSPNGEGVPSYLLDKHYLRKHGKNAYYGQK